MAVEQNPFTSPQHDVDVTYAIPVAVPGAGEAAATPATQRLRVQAATGRQRVDPPSSGAYMLTDGRTGRMVVVEPSLKLATVLPEMGPPIPPLGTRATGTFQRLGTQSVAGERCTDWRTRDLSGHDSVVCLTDDGVLLRIGENGAIRAQAIRVDRAPQPDSVFAVPSGFRRQDAPSAPPSTP
ncbi:hypothetical protein NFI95_00540 [Acetobacteraceae bacterium KSS8]|uniref:Uncharacterized protein n=1 Tax=Endosaccharibacter trunci TaxID=2812733 RepID=A0ABT1W253_9PROT|nr:hypothetical protein [Acetobacteraceae bacterium KSS8]